MFTLETYSNVDHAKMQFKYFLVLLLERPHSTARQVYRSSTQAPTKRILKKELTFETRIGNRFHFGFKHALIQASPTFYLQKNGTIAYDILRMVAPMYNNTHAVERSIKLMK